jgi:hypothetical protein
MITPILEKLILDGKAQYKTFVAGFSQKHILNIPQNRFIIITDLWYTPTLYFPRDELEVPRYRERNMITQLTLLGDKGFNRFLFKNSIFANQSDEQIENGRDVRRANWITPNNPIHITTYLTHINNVSFTFSNSELIGATAIADAPNNVYALRPPADYGKQGQAGVINTTALSQTLLNNYEIDYHNQKLGAGTQGNNEFSYPVNIDTDLTESQRTELISYPIVNVGYVEILGQPDNIGY